MSWLLQLGFVVKAGPKESRFIYRIRDS